jgi:hypothetical protein
MNAGTVKGTGILVNNKSVKQKEIDYAKLGRDMAKVSFYSMAELDRANLNKQKKFPRECHYQDMAEIVARNLGNNQPGLFGSNRFGLLATNNYGYFEEVFMQTLDSMLKTEHQFKLETARLQRERDRRRIVREAKQQGQGQDEQLAIAS